MVWREITIQADISHVEKRMIRDKVKHIAKLNEISQFIATFLNTHNIALKISNYNLHIMIKLEKIDILANVAQLTLLKTFG